MSADLDEVICIDGWQPDESSYEKGYYPEGTRDKAVYLSPPDVGSLPLRPEWRYLLKQSQPRTPWQFWMEIIAYRIGQVMDVPVPPAYVGLRNGMKPDEAVYGALIEWFYASADRYVEGARLIGPLIADFDYKKGKQHNWQTILQYFSDVPYPEANRGRLVAHWAQVLAFDTVIGNTDRHPENWGMLGLADSSGVITVGPSPAFDNGTALSYERLEEQFSRFDDEEYTRRYLTKARRARHHMRWSLDEQEDMNFFDFMRRFVREYPQTKDSILRRLQFTEADLRAKIGGLPSIPVAERWRLTPARLNFTLAMVMKRASLLRSALESI